MRRLSFVTLALAFTALAVCYGIALNRTGRANRGSLTGPKAGDPGPPAAPAPATGRRAPEAEQAANARRDQIRAEIEALGDHPWAGEYYAGDGLGANTVILLGPTAGYVFEWHGCLGVYDRNYGPVTEKDGRLRLGFAFPNPKEGLRAAIAPEMIPLRWGDRRYLIPADDVVGFCNKVHQGLEPHPGGFYLLRRGDRDKAAAGPKDLPPEFQAYLLPEPTEVTVSAVGASTTRPGWAADFKFKDTPLTFDAGKNRGLKVGMEFFVREPDGSAWSVTLANVGDDRSEAVLSQMGEESPGPRVGWRASTRLPWLSGTR